MSDGHCLNILLFWRRSTAALVCRVGACLEVSLFFPPFSHSSPSLIGLLASVDVKQQILPAPFTNTFFFLFSSFLFSAQTPPHLLPPQKCLYLPLTRPTTFSPKPGTSSFVRLGIIQGPTTMTRSTIMQELSHDSVS